MATSWGPIDEKRAEAFARAYVSGARTLRAAAAQAALDAGYAPEDAESAGKRLLRRADVMAEIAKENHRFADSQAAQMLVVLSQIAVSNEQNSRDRIAAANSVLDRSSLRRGQKVEHEVSTNTVGNLIREVMSARSGRLVSSETNLVLEGQAIEIAGESPDING